MARAVDRVGSRYGIHDIGTFCPDSDESMNCVLGRSPHLRDMMSRFTLFADFGNLQNFLRKTGIRGGKVK